MENNQDKGFTLVELLIVIVILGILATVTVFAVRGITDKGQENACSVEARTLDTAIEAFYAQNQLDVTQVTTNLAADGTTVNAIAGLVPEFLKTAPDPAKFTFVAGVPASGGDPATQASFTSAGVCVPT
ncbi:MAG: prepilin-type N-terminal cleavage/methylation domain-containing protein [Candidatus Azotimanducaceae bacterium]|jgi:prepilin-type N-terminal cleavage/methylation domain-containing protein